MAFIQPSSEPDEQKISKINAAGLINLTMERLWNASYDAMAIGSFTLWNSKLDAVWVILGGDEEEGGDVEKTYNRIELELHQLGALAKSKTGFVVENSSLTRAKQYLVLKKKALFLRRLQNSQGKGTAYDSGDNDDFE